MQINWSVYQNDINAIKQLWETAHIDALTKLYNRYGMENMDHPAVKGERC